MFRSNMADQYSNFTNPTIQPEQKYGFQGANQSLQAAGGGIAQYLLQRQQQGQGLQLQQAQQLANAQAMSMAYTGRRNPNIDVMLSQNPYGKFIMPQGGQSQGAGTPQPGSNVMSSTLMGVSPASAMFGAGGNVTPMGAPTSQTGGQTTPQVGQSQGGTANFSPFNPLASGPVATSSTSEYQPYVGMIPKSVTTQNPAGEAAVAGAKSYAEKSAAAQQGAQESESRDIQQLAMVKNAIKPLVDNYNQVYDSKALGLPAAGDIYGSNIVKNADYIPRGLQNSIVSPDTQKAAGQFLANKNELVTKLQPLLSQQFGKEGSSRIMENLIKMSQQEIGDLSTPKDQFKGQIAGTLSSLYRISKASQAYAKDLSASGQPTPDPSVAAQEISSRMAMQDLSPSEQKELSGMIDDVMGKKYLPTTADFNPLSKATNQQTNSPIQPSGKQLDMKTAQGLLQSAGGDKDKARQLAKNMGYSL